MVRQIAAKTTKMTSQKCSYGTVKGLYSKLSSSWYHRLLLKTNGKHKTNKKVARSKFKIEPQMSRTVGAAPWETNIRSELWRAVHVSCKGYWQMRVILNFVDRPIELLRHQNAGRLGSHLTEQYEHFWEVICLVSAAVCRNIHHNLLPDIASIDSRKKMTHWSVRYTKRGEVTFMRPVKEANRCMKPVQFLFSLIFRRSLCYSHSHARLLVFRSSQRC